MTPAEIEAYEARLIIADVLEALEAVDEAWAGQISTHYPGAHYEDCWLRHAQCLSLHVRSLIEDGADR